MNQARHRAIAAIEDVLEPWSGCRGGAWMRRANSSRMPAARAHTRDVGLPRDLYRCVLAVALGLVLLMAMVVFLPYVLAGSTVGWRDGRLLLGVAAAVYGSVATVWMGHHFGGDALKLRPTRRQKIEITVVVMAAVCAFVGASLAIIPGANS